MLIHVLWGFTNKDMGMIKKAMLGSTEQHGIRMTGTFMMPLN